jgi:hypothetical protein
MRRRRWLLLAPIIALLVACWLVGCKRSDSATSPTPAPSSEPSLASSAAARSGSSAAAAPADTARPTGAWKRLFLRRIDAKGPGKPSYLFGTIHVPDERFDAMPATLDRALDSADAVYTEVPFDSATQLAMVPKLMLPKGKSLDSMLPKKLHAKVEQAFADKGLPFAPFERMKPWVVATQLVMIDKLMLLASKKPLDAAIYARAEGEGKQVGGLETVDEQLALFDGLPQREQVHMLQTTVDLIETMKKQHRDPLGELMSSYLAGDDAKLSKSIAEQYDADDPLAVKLIKRVLWDRNARLADRIGAKLKADPDKAQFFAVGSGHVVGDDNIVPRLRKKGYVLTRVEP